MGISTADYIRLLQRTQNLRPTLESVHKPVEREKDLHEQIMAYCHDQWPRWKTIHSRMDQASTTEVGAPDFIIFMPGGKTLIIEAKKKLGKCSAEQLGYHLELSLLGHKCHVIQSFERFLELVKQSQT